MITHAALTQWHVVNSLGSIHDTTVQQRNCLCANVRHSIRIGHDQLIEHELIETKFNEQTQIDKTHIN